MPHQQQATISQSARDVNDVIRKTWELGGFVRRDVGGGITVAADSDTLPKILAFADARPEEAPSAEVKVPTLEPAATEVVTDEESRKRKHR